MTNEQAEALKAYNETVEKVNAIPDGFAMAGLVGVSMIAMATYNLALSIGVGDDTMIGLDELTDRLRETFGELSVPKDLF